MFHCLDQSSDTFTQVLRAKFPSWNVRLLINEVSVWHKFDTARVHSFSLSKKPYSYCSVLVGSRNRSNFDLVIVVKIKV